VEEGAHPVYGFLHGQEQLWGEDHFPAEMALVVVLDLRGLHLHR
jgi:hypothetical protein